jgi:hypothetical protein
MLKNGKDLSKLVPNTKILKDTKKHIYGFCQQISQAMDEDENFLANSQILGSFWS